MASQEELQWWNKFADVMAEQWMLTPAMNKMIRADYENDYAEYLFRPQGTFLEIGCGTGWIGHKFAHRGMQVDGLDFAEGQLDIARRLAAEQSIAGQTAYFTRDLVNDPLDGRFPRYDSVLISAVLHHLAPAEVESLMARVSQVLAPGGRLYIYEPLQPHRESLVRRVLVYPIDFVLRALLFVINRAGRAMNLFKANFAEAMREGYTGSSPDERSIPIERLRRSLSQQGLAIVEERPFHTYSIAIAMSIIRLRPRLVSFFTPFVRVFYKLDALLFRSIGWQNFGEEKWVLCSIKAEKPAS